MALSRRQTVFSFESSDGFNTYMFEVVQDASGNLSVRNIRTPRGILRDSLTNLPEFVVDDMCEAQNQVEDLVGQTSTINGTATLTAQTSVAVTFTNALASAAYRVSLDVSDNVSVWTSNKTTTGFTINVSSTYTGSIGYDVFV